MNGPPSSRGVPLDVERLEDRCVLSSSAYVSALYADLLHRAPSAGEVAGFVGQLDAGAPPIQITATFTSSPEFQSNLIVANYQLFLNRVPSPGELQAWLGLLQSGANEQQMESAVLGSAEFFALHGNDNGKWVQAVYQAVLGRSAGPNAGAWVGQLQSGVPRQGIALQILGSPESDMRIVTAAYQQLFGRAPDPAGLAYWTTRLEQGLMPSQLLAQLASSTELINGQGGLDPVPVAAPVPVPVPVPVNTFIEPVVAGPFFGGRGPFFTATGFGTSGGFSGSGSGF